MDTPRDDISGLGLLSDPARRSLYDFVVKQQAPVTREDAAQATGISRTLAAYHLDKLAEAGLFDISYARKPGRGGPGSGRPAKQYRRAERELSVSFPPRNYSLLAQILADAAEGASGSVQKVLADAAEHAGRALGEQTSDMPAALTAAGYEPAMAEGGQVILHNCPFHSVKQEHPKLVCALNHAVIRGALEGTGEDPTRAELDPCDGRCCIVIHPETGRS